jgi:6-phosphofructokinase 2
LNLIHLLGKFIKWKIRHYNANSVNPALDKSAHLKDYCWTKKIRCEQPRFDAGGGGINVSKAISSLVESHCFTAGGPTGEMIKDLLTDEGVNRSYGSIGLEKALWL